MDIDPEMAHRAHLAHLLRSKEQLRQVPVVLAHGPESLPGIDVGPVPLEKVLGRGDIFGDGLLRQDMLAGQECFPDKLWLDQDGEAVVRSISLYVFFLFSSTYPMITAPMSERASRSA